MPPTPSRIALPAPFDTDALFLQAVGDAIATCAAQRIALRPTDFINGLLVRSRQQADWSLGLCVTTKNRLWQLKTALPLNILGVWPHRAFCRIHLAVCDDTEETMSWVTSTCSIAMAAGVLQVYAVPHMRYWHASIGKNTSHRPATEVILCNLDGDNIISPEFVLETRKRITSVGHMH